MRASKHPSKRGRPSLQKTREPTPSARVGPDQQGVSLNMESRVIVVLLSSKTIQSVVRLHKLARIECVLQSSYHGAR